MDAITTTQAEYLRSMTPAERKEVKRLMRKGVSFAEAMGTVTHDR
jgi:hypothetical protein